MMLYALPLLRETGRIALIKSAPRNAADVTPDCSTMAWFAVANNYSNL